MKRQSMTMWLAAILVCISMLPGCSDREPAAHGKGTQSVEQIGQVPEKFKAIIEKNLFCGITAFDGRLLKTEICAQDKESRTALQRVWMMDEYGNELAAYACSSDDAYRVSTLTATDDGGFIFVLGFSDYAYGQNDWASGKGFASRVIKIDKDGNLQFETPLAGVEGSALRFCFEKNGRFYFFGTTQTPETKTQGVYSPTDIFMAVLDEKGAVVKTRCIAGADYDSLDAAEPADNTFLLSVRSQSDDGDFAGSDSDGYPVGWVIAVDDTLEITQKEKGTGREYFDDRIGKKNGSPLYKSDALFQNFDAGTVTAFIDYGDSYLVVSENNTGSYENTPPVISSIWYYTETVYSLYDPSGELLFSASVDSSPDYDAMVQAIIAGNGASS